MSIQKSYENMNGKNMKTETKYLDKLDQNKS